MARGRQVPRAEHRGVLAPVPARRAAASVGGGRLVARPGPADEPRRRGRAVGGARGMTQRPAFYALDGGGWRDYWTLLHPPYTLWHLSFVAIGACIVPVIRPAYLGLAILAFFLAVGIAAHALDELRGRPLRTRISGPDLDRARRARARSARPPSASTARRSSRGGACCSSGSAGSSCPRTTSSGSAARSTPICGSRSCGAGSPRSRARSRRWDGSTLRRCSSAPGCALIAAAQRRLSTPVRRIRRRVTSVSGVLAEGRRVRTDHRSDDHGGARGSAAAHVDRDGGAGGGSRDQPLAVGLLSRRSSGADAPRR